MVIGNDSFFNQQYFCKDHISWCTKKAPYKCDILLLEVIWIAMLPRPAKLEFESDNASLLSF